MGRVPCCEKDNVKRGQWTPEEDNKLSSYISQHGTRNWRLIPKNAGLQRCGKSCRLRWTNYLRPDLKHGEFSDAEEHTIVKLHSVVGNRWSLIAAQLPGRTDNDVKNHWNTKLKKKLSGMGIDPVTHKPFSHLMAEIANTLPPPQVAHLAEAALGCFKDEMLHLLTKKHVDLATGSLQPPPMIFSGNMNEPGACLAYHHTMNNTMDNDKEDTIQKIKLGLSRAIMQEPGSDKSWGSIGINGDPSNGLANICDDMYPVMGNGFRYGGPSSYRNDGEESGWSQSICTGSTCIGGEGQVVQQHINGLNEKSQVEEEEEELEAEGGSKVGRKVDSEMLESDCVLWDLSDDLMNPIV